MILTREQIDAHAALRKSMDDPFVNGQFRLDSSRLWSLINGTGDLIATARAYHDLRDAVLALCDAPDGAFMAAYVLVPRIREVVARVEES